MELVVVVKRGCDTCRLVEPVLVELHERCPTIVYSQDDPSFPAVPGGAVDDTALLHSWRMRVEATPTLIRLEDGREVERSVGWDRAEWGRITGLRALGEDLPARRPGCGSRTLEPGMPERLALASGELRFASRAIHVTDPEDAVEMAFDRGWSDGLPVVPPTPLRVARMLSGTTRRADEVLGLIPPNLAACTVEKAAVNAVLAGCRPEYFPVVLSVIEAALQPEFALHALLATLWFSGPVVIVNGPVVRLLGLNSGGNVFGQGNRANATIGRALQLIVRNVGGGRPGEIDRAVFGHPGKFTFCFAEDESDPRWVPLNVARGSRSGTSTVTLFQGDGVQGIAANLSRTPEALARSLALGLMAVLHPKYASASDAILALSPDHYEIFRSAGWGRVEIESALHEALRRPGHALVRGEGGVDEGIDAERAGESVDKFKPGGLLVVRAGGRGAAISAVIGGWPAQRDGASTRAVTREITP